MLFKKGAKYLQGSVATGIASFPPCSEQGINRRLCLIVFLRIRLQTLLSYSAVKSCLQCTGIIICVYKS